MKLLIRHGRLIDPVSGIGGVMDILMEDGRVTALGTDVDSPDAQVLDAQGLMVSAGFVDMHVHLREPGYTHKETIATGRMAAMAGGFTTIACMPNTKPVIDTPEWVEFVRREGAKTPGTRVLPIGALTVGEQGKELTDGAALKRAGAVALSDDGRNVQSAEIMRDGLIKCKRWGLPILAHCEDEDLVKNYAVNEGPISRALGLPGRPAIAEELIVSREGMLAEETGGTVHICHVSTAKSVSLIRQFKHKGVNITCETCPQYFTLTEDDVLKKGAMARVNPPLRTKNDVDAIIAGLRDGTIDVIATDHAPHHIEEKCRGLADAPSGMVGLETALAVTLTALYHTGKMSLSGILRKMTANPAGILRIPSGRLALGDMADVTIFDPDEPWTVRASEFRSMGRNTPFDGMEVKGKVKYTIVGGEVVYKG